MDAEKRHHRATNVHRSAPSVFGPSWMENSTHPDRFLVLHNLCLEAHRIHFFDNAKAAAQFIRTRQDYRVWQGLSRAKARPPNWHFDVVNHEGQDAAASLNLSRARWIRQTGLLQVPHRSMDNMYHFHNNFLLPLLLNWRLSKSDNLHSHLLLFKTWPNPSGKSRLTPQPWPYNATHPAFFYALQKLFVEVAWPVEDLWQSHSAICFRRLVWSQVLSANKQPYYDYVPSEHAYREAAVPAFFRDRMRAALGVPPRPPSGLRLGTPTVVWISRKPTCLPNSGQHLSITSLGRCIANLDEVLSVLRHSHLFRVVHNLDDFKVRVETKARDALLMHQIEVLRDADILMGVHGAGLTNILFLNERAAVVELKDHFWYGEGGKLLIYQTMARLQGCSYMSVDIRGAMPNRTRDGYVLNPPQAALIGHKALGLWRQTQLNVSRPPMLGQCCFEHREKVVCKCPHVLL